MAHQFWNGKVCTIANNSFRKAKVSPSIQAVGLQVMKDNEKLATNRIALVRTTIKFTNSAVATQMIAMKT